MQHKNVLLGITGGIAAYKSADLVRRLKEQGANVKVAMTRSAKAFITPLTMQAVSGNPVHEELLDSAAEAAMGHIELARWADVICIAPATAEFLTKLAYGHADDLLTTICLATTAPIAVAPAMNQQMWQNLATQKNVQRLLEHGIQMIGPGFGSQACGEYGPGRMLEPMELLQAIAGLLAPKNLVGKRILLTAGPTHEHLDPVRFITNHSSGKMGYAIAQAAVAAGAQVTLISGPVSLPVPAHIKCIKVVTALEMRDTVMKAVADCDIFIAAAAVADYRFANQSKHKQSKSTAELTLQLVPNPDIVAEVAALPNRPLTIGFAAETQDVVTRAKAKLKAKGLDMIAANQVGVAHGGFHSDQNALSLLWQNGQRDLPSMPKPQLAREFIATIAEVFYAKTTG